MLLVKLVLKLERAGLKMKRKSPTVLPVLVERLEECAAMEEDASQDLSCTLLECLILIDSQHFSLVVDFRQQIMAACYLLATKVSRFFHRDNYTHWPLHHDKQDANGPIFHARLAAAICDMIQIIAERDGQLNLNAHKQFVLRGLGVIVTKLLFRLWLVSNKCK